MAVLESLGDLLEQLRGFLERVGADRDLGDVGAGGHHDPTIKDVDFRLGEEALILFGAVAGVEENDVFAGKIEAGAGPEGNALSFEVDHGVPAVLAALLEFFQQTASHLQKAAVGDVGAHFALGVERVGVFGLDRDFQVGLKSLQIAAELFRQKILQGLTVEPRGIVQKALGRNQRQDCPERIEYRKQGGVVEVSAGPEDGFAELFRVQVYVIHQRFLQVQIIQNDGGEAGHDGRIAQGISIVEMAVFAGGSLGQQKGLLGVSGMVGGAGGPLGTTFAGQFGGSAGVDHGQHSARFATRRLEGSFAIHKSIGGTVVAGPVLGAGKLFGLLVASRKQTNLALDGFCRRPFPEPCGGRCRGARGERILARDGRPHALPPLRGMVWVRGVRARLDRACE